MRRSRSDDIQARVRDVIGTVLGIRPTSIRPDDDLFDRAGYDSMAVVRVLDQVESIFDLEVPGDWLIIEKFQSVASISALVLRIQASTTLDPLPESG